MDKERYNNLDGLRAYACIGIILMHIRANGDFAITGFAYDKIIASFTNFTFLFMVLSAFSMCCGYYERFKSSSISLERFYVRRYERIWPFFAILCTIELIVDHSLTSLYEWFADLTLAFGLLPNAKISVVGVGWFIGVIFVFYMIFPFFTFLIGNKKRAWVVFTIAVILNILCTIYFFDENHVLEEFGDRSNIIFSSMFFVAGGLIYLYREQIKRVNTWIVGASVLLSCLFYYFVNASQYTMLVLFSLLSILGIRADGTISRVILQNKVISFIAKISMEIFLCHMFVYRVIERLKLLHITGNEYLNYIAVSAATVIGAVVMAFVLKKLIESVQKKVAKAA